MAVENAWGIAQLSTHFRHNLHTYERGGKFFIESVTILLANIPFFEALHPAYSWPYARLRQGLLINCWFGL